MFLKIISAIILIIVIYAGLPTLVERVYGRKKFTKDKKIALTFDDGPGEYTEKILDILKVYDIKASFFIVSKNVLKYPETMKRIILEGHEICLHSKDHKSNLFRNYKMMDKDFKDALEILKEFDVSPRYFRPPWGIFNISMYFILSKYHLQKVVWNVMIGDWSKRVNGDILNKRLIKKVGCGSIICIHDAGTAYGPKNTLKALEIFLPKTLEEGFEFVGISDTFQKVKSIN